MIQEHPHLATNKASARPVPRPDVFAYSDFRKFLLDFIAHRKTLKRSYSRAQFARSIGFSSESGLNMVLTGKRNLRGPYLDKCVRNLRLSIQERLYFEALIRSADMAPQSRKNLLREIEILSGKWEPPANTGEIRLIDYFLVQQILCLVGNFLSAEEVRSLFRYEISIEEIRSVLDWMREKGFVATKDGKYKAMKSVMTVKDEVPNVSLRRGHTDAFKIAEQALHSDPIEAREFQTYFFTIEKSRLGELKHRIKQMVLDVVSEFETETTASTVVQMHFHLFEAIQSATLERWRNGEKEHEKKLDS